FGREHRFLHLRMRVEVFRARIPENLATETASLSGQRLSQHRWYLNLQTLHPVDCRESVQDLWGDVLRSDAESLLERTSQVQELWRRPHLCHWYEIERLPQ